MYVCGTWVSPVEVRVQLMGVISLLPLKGQTLINRLGGKHLYPLSHLAGPNIVSSDFKHKG